MVNCRRRSGAVIVIEEGWFVQVLSMISLSFLE